MNQNGSDQVHQEEQGGNGQDTAVVTLVFHRKQSAVEHDRRNLDEIGQLDCQIPDRKPCRRAVAVGIDAVYHQYDIDSRRQNEHEPDHE